MVFYDELRILVDEVADRVDRWTGNTAWVFESGSAAAAEVANKEKRLDGSPWGESPVRTVYQFALMETKLAVEMSRCVALLIGSGRPAPGIETVSQASLEAGSVVWWLLEKGLLPGSGSAGCSSCAATAPASWPGASRRWART